MKKLSKIFAVVLCLALALSMLPVGASAAADTLTFDFTSLTAKGTEIEAANALSTFNGCATGTGLTAVTLTKIYNGNGSGGGLPSTAGFLKTGTGSVEGDIAMTFSKKVTKVEILCHDFYSKSASYPNNNNKVSVNGSAEQLSPYTEDCTFSTLTFELATASNDVNIHVTDARSTAAECKGGRIFIKSIVVTFEEGATETTGAADTTAAAGTTSTKAPSSTGDSTAIVSMTTVMVLAVTALAVLVIGNKKRMF